MQIQENFNLVKHNTFGLDVCARYFCRISNQRELTDVLAHFRQKSLQILVIGGGSNIVFSGDFAGLVILIDFRGVHIDGQKVVVGAGENWHWLVRHTLHSGLSGLENLSLIPGLVGGAPVQNIGAYGQQLDRVLIELSATDLVTGEEKKFTNEDCRFGYRHSIFKEELKDRLAITEVTLRLSSDFVPNIDYEDLAMELENRSISLPQATHISDAVIAVRNRKLPDPGDEGNVGSFFKNPEISSQALSTLRERWPDVPAHQSGAELHKIPAAWLIETAGLKGLVMGGAMISTRHALVIVNQGSASCADVLALGSNIEEQVLTRFDIRLEMEPVVY